MAKTEKRERNRAATQRRILDAAEAEFSKTGFKGTRLRTVASRAGVHHALLHHYYGNKIGLFRAVLENAFSGVSLRAMELLGKKPDLRALLGQYVDLLIDLHVEHPNLIRLLHLAALDTGSPSLGVLEGGIATFAQPVLDGLAAEIEKAQARGEVRDDMDARRVIAMGIGAVAYMFSEDQFFEAFLGAPVREAANVAAHRDAALRFLGSALFV